MPHPHPDKAHLVRAYRGYILGEKRRMAGRANSIKAFRRGARGLIHYLDYVQAYLEAKRELRRCSSVGLERTPDKGEVRSSMLLIATKV